MKRDTASSITHQIVATLTGVGAGVCVSKSVSEI
ncbi:hypothetical protein Vi05172_g2178 [Venturia inaequalis]|nr:hypothetical protein Vi05172_g2178 [Venturia inaequalis]